MLVSFWSSPMADLTDSDKTILLVVILIVAIITIYAELRIRKIGVGKKYSANRFKKDQAFNALHTTKAIRNKLRAERVDTAKADYMIQRAESALNSNEHDSCIDLCQRAREELIKKKQEGTFTAEPESTVNDGDFKLPTEMNDAPIPATRRVKTQEKSVDTLQLQAKFELRAAQGDLDTFSGDSDVRQKASQFIDESQRHMDAGEYQKSLSDSFKARRLISGEPLPDKIGETREPMAVEEGAAKELEMIETPVDGEWEPSSQIIGKCKKCGTEYDADDVFCHFCGSPLKAKKCPSCGAELKGIEKFCRKCGKRVNS
jgi:Double zinc ribbon